jgi:hypothetical protein
VRYNQPGDQPNNPNAPYVDGNPGAGIQGSIVPAAGVEFDQREIIEVITRANVRLYSDFDGVPCGVPSNADLQQLRKAIEGFITNWAYIISTEVTFTVHGPGANFTDLNAAFKYLGKYRITPTGHVILQLAGAAPGSAQSAQWVYTQGIEIAHPNNDRISIFGAPMLAPVSRNDTGYAWNGNSSSQRALDLTTNLAVLRTKFATELHFSGVVPAAVRMGGVALMHMDGILFTSDGNLSSTGVSFNCSGYMNTLPRTLAGDTGWAYDGLAAVNFKGKNYSFLGGGFHWDVGACMAINGETQDQNFCTPFIAIGNWVGMSCTNGGFVTCNGNCISLGNDQIGFQLYPRSGTQWDGGMFINANGGNGIECYLCSTGYISGPLTNGNITTAPSHCFKNAGWGIYLEETNVSMFCDFGAGANANVSGQIFAGNNAACQLWGSYANYTPCSPAFGVNGNNNSMIASGW